jgi:hypothetical protein
MVDSGSQSTKGLIIVSKLYQEGRIDDDQRDQLKGKLIFELQEEILHHPR